MTQDKFDKANSLSDNEPFSPSEPGEETGALGAPDLKLKVARASLSLVLIVFLALLAAGLAGTFLRDEIEGRKVVLDSPPPEAEQVALPVAGTGEAPAAAKSGGGLNRVRVGSPVVPEESDTAKTAPEASAETMHGGKMHLQSSAAKNVVEETPSSGLVRPDDAAASPPAAQNRPEGSIALLINVYRSQRYLMEMEARLDKMGLDHFRVEDRKKWSAFMVAASLPDELATKKARLALGSRGYAYTLAEGTLEAFFFLEDEAQKALLLLSEKGLKGGYSMVEGVLPIWRLYTGPFTEEILAEKMKLLEKNNIKYWVNSKP